MKKKVSVIMSTYKTPYNYLSEAINSVLNQTYQNLELIIICDGDKNEFNKINEEFKNNKIKVFYNEENKGLPYSLNKAISLSTGDYIARMDSDDICIKDRIEKQVKYLDEHQEVFICGTSAKLFEDAKGIKTIYLNSMEEIKVQLLYRATLIHPTVMIRRQVFNEYKYNEKFKYSQDFELWSRVIEKYKIAFLPFIGLNYRVHNKQVSIEKKNEQMKLAREVIKKNTEKITGKFDSKIYYTLCVLGGKENITRKNYYEISKSIDYLIENNKNFDKKNLTKVLYNRFFEIIVKNKFVTFNFNVLRKCIKIYNFKEIMEVLKNAK